MIHKIGFISPASFPFRKTYSVCYQEKRVDGGIYTVHELRLGSFDLDTVPQVRGSHLLLIITNKTYFFPPTSGGKNYVKL